MPFINSLKSYLSSVIAHRGASFFAPENTLVAFKKAAEIGAKWVEFDVMLDASNEIIVIHDDTLERTTNGKGMIGNVDYSYLKTLDAGGWFNPVFAGERIPKLKDVIELLIHLNLCANIEIKPCPGREEKTVKNVLEIIDQFWIHEKNPPLISSFSELVLKYVSQNSKKYFLGFLMNRDWIDDWENRCNELNCATVHMHYSLITRERINLIKATNRLVLAYTVDDPLLANRLFDLGVDAIFSNCPKEMLGFFAK